MARVAPWALLVASCGRQAAGPAAPPPPSRSPLTLRGPGVEATATLTPAQPKVGEFFTLAAAIRDAQGKPLQPSACKLDATMPSHGHGMMTEPSQSVRDGHCQAEGMKLHMHGAWKLHLEATVEGRTVRAEADWQQAPEAL